MYAFRLLEMDASAPGWTRRLDSPLVGRQRELASLERFLEERVEGSDAGLMTLMGAAGAGKSRLCLEFLSAVGGGATVLSGRCLPYGEGITFWPIAAVLREAAGIDDRQPREQAQSRLSELVGTGEDADLVAERLAPLVGADIATPGIQETFWAVRKLFESLGHERPLVVVFDDIQWAEPTFLDLLEYLGDWIRTAPVLLLCLARPELLELRPGWTSAKPNAALLQLERLNEAEIDGLIQNLTGGAELRPDGSGADRRVRRGQPALRRGDAADAGRRRHPAAARGNLGGHRRRFRPRDSGHDQRAADRPARPPGRRGARRDRAGGGRGTRVLAERRHPPLADGDGAARDPQAPVADAEGADPPGPFRTATRRRSGSPTSSSATPPTPRSRRPTGRSCTNSWPSGWRWSPRTSPASGRRSSATTWSRPTRSLLELGPPSERTERLGLEAARELGTAGRRSFDRGDMPAAVKLLSRAVALLPAQAPRRAELLPELALALFETGDFGRLQEVVAETAEAASASADPSLEAYASILRLWIDIAWSPWGWADEAEREASRAIAAFERSGDERGLAKAWALRGQVNLVRGRFAAAEEAWEEAAEHARRAGDRRDELESLAWVPLVVWAGPTPAERGVERCEDVRGGRAATRRSPPAR